MLSVYTPKVMVKLVYNPLRLKDCYFHRSLLQFSQHKPRLVDRNMSGFMFSDQDFLIPNTGTDGFINNTSMSSAYTPVYVGEPQGSFPSITEVPSNLDLLPTSYLENETSSGLKLQNPLYSLERSIAPGTDMYPSTFQDTELVQLTSMTSVVSDLSITHTTRENYPQPGVLPDILNINISPSTYIHAQTIVGARTTVFHPTSLETSYLAQNPFDLFAPSPADCASIGEHLSPQSPSTQSAVWMDVPTCLGPNEELIELFVKEFKRTIGKGFGWVMCSLCALKGHSKLHNAKPSSLERHLFHHFGVKRVLGVIIASDDSLRRNK
ncbi:unnamed protein product [Rhizoctonia solani]|uniref:Uncharacterized protein n=1 Tax=Rhizoctonia solani TaxID=456999 RepID=A0A8H2XNM1_9AGAM|nr:unnamed protein product [Rhizoctonia solani]